MALTDEMLFGVQKDHLDEWHHKRSWVPVPQPPDLASTQDVNSSINDSDAISPERSDKCIVQFSSVCQRGPGVALIEALNHRDMWGDDELEVDFKFDENPAREIVPFVSNSVVYALFLLASTL